MDRIEELIKTWVSEIELIPQPRREHLLELANNVLDRLYSVKEKETVTLAFICTHNSRRSQIAELLSFVLIDHYQIRKIRCLSAGTEKTETNKRVITALTSCGFVFEWKKTISNPRYHYITQGGKVKGIYSKTIEQLPNGGKDFFKIMVCDDADQKCPFIPISERFALKYTDPKYADDTPDEEEVYLKKVHEIGRELTFLFQSFVALKNARPSANEF